QPTSVADGFGLAPLGAGEADSPRLALHPGDFGRLVRLQVRAHRHTVLAGKGRHLLDVAAQDGLVDNQTRRVEFVAVPHRLPPPSPDHTGHFFPLVSIQRCNSWLRCTESSTSCTFMPSSNDGTALLPSRIPRTHSRASSTNGRTRRSAKFGRTRQTSGSSIPDKTCSSRRMPKTRPSACTASKASVPTATISSPTSIGATADTWIVASAPLANSRIRLKHSLPRMVRGSAPATAWISPNHHRSVSM